MDGWGDPWADDSRNHEDDQPVTAAPRTTGVFLGLDDDAGWGAQEDINEEDLRAFVEKDKQEDNEDGWPTPAFEGVSSVEEQVRDGSAEFAATTKHLSDPANWRTNGAIVTSKPGDYTWKTDAAVPDAEHHSDNEVLDAADTERSESVTVVDGNEAPIPREDGPQATDDDASIRESTSAFSSSDHTDEHGKDSPRTSLDDDAQTAHLGNQQAVKPQREFTIPVVDTTGEEDDFGDFAAEENTSTDTVVDEAQSATAPGAALKAPAEGHVETPTDTKVSRSGPRRRGPTISIDLGLVEKIFPSKTSVPPDVSFDNESDVISTTSSRKAWYRVSRPQTMREDNNGYTEGYVRIQYRGSAIQGEMNKIMAQWGTEDRARGRVVFGTRSGPMFGWTDSPTATQPSSPWHQRGRSDGTKVDTRKAILAAKVRPQQQRHNTVTSASSPRAQFNWSSSPLNPTPAVLLSEDVAIRSAQQMTKKPVMKGISPTGTATTSPIAQFGWGSSRASLTPKEATVTTPTETSRKPADTEDPLSVVSPRPPVADFGWNSTSLPPEPTSALKAEVQPEITQDAPNQLVAHVEIAELENTPSVSPTTDPVSSVPQRFPPVRQKMGERILSFGSPSKNVKSRLSSTSRERAKAESQDLPAQHATSSPPLPVPKRDLETRSIGSVAPPADQWNALDKLDVLEPATSIAQGVANPSDDFDDDWGEMISSPAIASPASERSKATIDDLASASNANANGLGINATDPDADFSLFDKLTSPLRSLSAHTKTQSLSSAADARYPASVVADHEWSISGEAPPSAPAKHTRFQSIPQGAFASTSLSSHTVNPANRWTSSRKMRRQGDLSQDDDEAVKMLIEGIPDFNFMLR